MNWLLILGVLLFFSNSLALGDTGDQQGCDFWYPWSCNPSSYCVGETAPYECNHNPPCCDAETLSGLNCAGTKQPDCSNSGSYCIGKSYPSPNGCGTCNGTKGPDFDQSACSAYGLNCGTYDAGCGYSVNCGTCTYPNVCTDGRCSCVPDCSGAGNVCAGVHYPDPTGCRACIGTKGPDFDQSACSKFGLTCGIYDAGCENTVNCGTCTPPATCVNGHCEGNGGNGCIPAGCPAACATTCLGEYCGFDCSTRCYGTMICDTGEIGVKCGGSCTKNSECFTGLFCNPYTHKCDDGDACIPPDSCSPNNPNCGANVCIGAPDCWNGCEFEHGTKNCSTCGLTVTLTANPTSGPVPFTTTLTATPSILPVSNYTYEKSCGRTGTITDGNNTTTNKFKCTYDTVPCRSRESASVIVRKKSDPDCTDSDSATIALEACVPSHDCVSNCNGNTDCGYKTDRCVPTGCSNSCDGVTCTTETNCGLCGSGEWKEVSPN
ncbi:MAG: hypothetical protein WC848_06330 [Parcubacteria group bacterium]